MVLSLRVQWCFGGGRERDAELVDERDGQRPVLGRDGHAGHVDREHEHEPPDRAPVAVHRQLDLVARPGREPAHALVGGAQ